MESIMKYYGEAGFYEYQKTCLENGDEIDFELFVTGYIEIYGESIIHGLNLDSVADQIKNDKFLSSGHYDNIKREVIEILYEGFFFDRKNGIEFLEHFIDDDEIRKYYLAHTRTKSNHGS
jgi:hypothetical protein